MIYSRQYTKLQTMSFKFLMAIINCRYIIPAQYTYIRKLFVLLEECSFFLPCINHSHIMKQDRGQYLLPKTSHLFPCYKMALENRTTTFVGEIVCQDLGSKWLNKDLNQDFLHLATILWNFLLCIFENTFSQEHISQYNSTEIRFFWFD
jgi:hypothetical protein